MELLQIATAFLLQSATRFITNCDRYYKVRWIYYKSRQLLQSAMIIKNCDSIILPGISEFSIQMVSALGFGWYVEMCVNKLSSGVAPLLNRMDVEILSGVGRRFLLQNDA